MPSGKKDWNEPDTQLYWLEQVVNAMRRRLDTKPKEGISPPGAAMGQIPPEVTVPDYAWNKWEITVRGAAAALGMRVLTDHRYIDEPNSLRLVFELDT